MARRNSSTSWCAYALESSAVRAVSARPRLISHGLPPAFDGFWERDLQLWDIAAGFVLVQEAGGMTIGLDKKDATKGSFVTANTSLAPKITELVEGKLKKPAAGAQAAETALGLRTRRPRRFVRRGPHRDQGPRRDSSRTPFPSCRPARSRCVRRCRPAPPERACSRRQPARRLWQALQTPHREISRCEHQGPHFQARR